MSFTLTKNMYKYTFVLASTINNFFLTLVSPHSRTQARPKARKKVRLQYYYYKIVLIAHSKKLQ